jgi:hypothetical protein
VIKNTEMAMIKPVGTERARSDETRRQRGLKRKQVMPRKSGNTVNPEAFHTDTAMTIHHGEGVEPYTLPSIAITKYSQTMTEKGITQNRSHNLNLRQSDRRQNTQGLVGVTRLAGSRAASFAAISAPLTGRAKTNTMIERPRTGIQEGRFSQCVDSLPERMRSSR